MRGLLWPDSDENAAQTSLRNALWALKTTLSRAGFEGLQSDRTAIWLDPQDVVVDVDHLLERLEEGDLSPLRDMDPQALVCLDRDQVIINDITTARLRETSAHLARLVRHRLDAVASDASSDDQQTLFALQFIADMTPEDEGAARKLIHCYWQKGQMANALAAYQSLWNLLDEEFGEEPSPETQDLIVKIKASDRRTQALQTRPRIIVAEASVDHLPDRLAAQAGLLRDTLCANLARFREWQVFDARLVTQQTPTENAARTYLLSLQAQPLEQQLACRAVLSDSQTGELLWSENMGDPVPEVQQDRSGAADRLAVALNLHLSAYRGRQPDTNPTKTNAYERWVEAQGLVLQFTLRSWQQAERLLDSLIADYPNFSRGYSSRASIENMRQISFPGLYSVPAMHVEGLRFARRAIELDPMDSRGQLAMGWSAAMSRQFDRAELAFDLAFQYNQNDPWTITSAAVGLAFCDHYNVASRMLDLLFRLNFRLEAAHWSYVAATHFLGGNFEACVKASERSKEISHDVPAWHAAALALLDRREEAAEVAARFEQIARANWVAKGPVERAEITRWLISGFPIRNRDTWLKLRDGLRLAGMPVPTLVQSNEIALGYQMDTSDVRPR
ncbi:BTAD domain-containing putative transcriptional regulator [uncultured Tateyamaria sp.]|uniref:BTAD domain-containing putative transcriptional regulator n=2 Tax=Tateyamaria TaxID=299261 RepID=UPI00261E73D0|nr:BTAD domain-containing putative transcriptional regulator [uncultured Tateyamaria sp.]